jgi:hypothetical protein
LAVIAAFLVTTELVKRFFYARMTPAVDRSIESWPRE